MEAAAGVVSGVPVFWSRFFRLFGPFLADELRRAADIVEQLLPGPPTIAFAYFSIGGKQMQNPTLPDTQAPFGGSVTFVDAENNPTTLAADETVTWSSSDESIATVAADPSDPTKVTVSLTGALGVAVIAASSTNEAGTAVSAQGTITVVASDETAAQIDFAV
jgi:hypothetical protein